MIYLKKGTLFRIDDYHFPESGYAEVDHSSGLVKRLGILLSDVGVDNLGKFPISYWVGGSTRTSRTFRLMMANRFEVLSEGCNRDLLNIKFFEESYRRIKELSLYSSPQNKQSAIRQIKDIERDLRCRLIFIKEICSGKSTQEVQSINPLNKSSQEVQSTNLLNKSTQEIDSINPLNKSTQEICSEIYINLLEVLEQKGIRSVSFQWGL